MNPLATLSLLTLHAIGFAQAHDSGKASGITISFHVTSVRQEDESGCDPNECSSSKITIEGYADGSLTRNRILYILTCSEYLAYKPTPHITGTCAKLHADTDYDARVFGDSITFWPEESYTPPPVRVLYKIMSEKQISKPGK